MNRLRFTTPVALRGYTAAHADDPGSAVCLDCCGDRTVEVTVGDCGREFRCPTCDGSGWVTDDDAGKEPA